MSENDARRTVIVNAWLAAWDEGDFDGLEALAGPSYRVRARHGEEGQDWAAFKEMIISTRAAFPDLATTIDDVIVEGDKVAVRWHSVGTHEQAYFGVPRTGRRVEVSGVSFAQFEGDQIVEEFVTTDARAMLAALGIISVDQEY